MSGYWTLSNRSSGGVASASQAAAAAASSGNQRNRLRALVATLAGTVAAAGSAQLVVRDGPSGTGTIIFTADLSISGTQTAELALSDLDLRASTGNALTVEFVSGSGITGVAQSVNAQGDYVPQGWPLGMP